MDLPNTESATVKTEPGTQEEDGGEILCTDIDVEISDIKTECLEYSKQVNQAAGTQFSSDNKEHVKIEFDSNKDFKEIELIPAPSSFSYSNCIYSSSQISTEGNKPTPSQSSEKRFSCSDCNYTCDQMSHLRRHMVTHSGEKPFRCSECNHSFSQKSNLWRHMLKHSGAKPFTCSDCKYSSSRKSDLKIHMLTHSGEKPFSCSHCNYSCSQNSNLRRHALTHNGEKHSFDTTATIFVLQNQ